MPTDEPIFKDPEDPKFRFIDLFAGIGGFHYALQKLGGKCVFSCEIDKKAQETYAANFGQVTAGDIRLVNKVKDIADHDILTAGFPCQAFSVAGHKKGFGDTRGTLFHEVLEVIKAKNPPVIFLENVKHLVKHDNSNTWNIITEALKKEDYITTKEPLVLSPNTYGIPQLRHRVYILGVKKHIFKKIYPNEDFLPVPHIATVTNHKVLDKEVSTKYNISQQNKRAITAWNQVVKDPSRRTKALKRFNGPKRTELKGFPIWLDEFGKTYALTAEPDWEKAYIRKNRQLYITHKEFFDKWLELYQVLAMKKIHRKLEWHAKKDIKNIWDTYMQIRQSGIRCKQPPNFHTLVAIVQTPVLKTGNQVRYLTPRETARLQSFPDTFQLHQEDKFAYKQIGNSVNTHIIEQLAKFLLPFLTSP